jgi:hypothetical protein
MPLTDAKSSLLGQLPWQLGQKLELEWACLSFRPCNGQQTCCVCLSDGVCLERKQG